MTAAVQAIIVFAATYTAMVATISFLIQMHDRGRR